MGVNIAGSLNTKKEESQLIMGAFVEKAAISHTSMQVLFKGEGNPRLDTIGQLCKNFNMTPNRLLLGSSTEQFLLEYVIPNVVSKFSFEDQADFGSAFLKMFEDLGQDMVPYGSGISHEEMMNNMAEHLSAEKWHSKQTTKEFAKCAGLKETAMQHLLKGKGNPRLDVIQPLCVNLRMTPNRLFLRKSADQYLLDYVIPMIAEAPVFSSDKGRMVFLDQFTQDFWRFTMNKTPYDIGILHEYSEITDKVEELV